MNTGEKIKINVHNDESSSWLSKKVQAGPYLMTQYKTINLLNKYQFKLSYSKF